MNEGRKITVKEAESCMMADQDFRMHGNIHGAYHFKDGKYLYGRFKNSYNPDASRVGDMTCWASRCEIAADPNNTFGRLFGTERELTFEEVGAALFREDSIWLKRDSLWCQVKMNRSGHFYHRVINGVRWETFDDFRPEEDKYTLYKEPTHEPLTLESLEARVKALEARS